MSPVRIPMALSSLFSLLVVAAILISAAGGRRIVRRDHNDPATAEYIRRSCQVTRYPDVCVASLSSYALRANKQSELVKVAVQDTLFKARNTSAWASVMYRTKRLNKRESAAFRDCVENFGDTSDQIRQSLAELKHLRHASFKFQMSNVQTWMSAALTNEDSCLDGFQDVKKGRVKVLVHRRVQYVSKLISNALALVNRFATNGGY